MGSLRTVLLSTLSYNSAHIAVKSKYSMMASSMHTYRGDFQLLVKELTGWKNSGYRLILVCRSETRGKRLVKDLAEYDLLAFYSEDRDRVPAPGEIMIIHGSLHKGIQYPMIKFAIIAESDMFGEDKKKRRKRRQPASEGERIRSFKELSVGDYVVHEGHGVGIYRGIENVEVDGVAKDYIKIEYGGGGSLYILATNLDMIQKYADKDTKQVKINKMSGPEWTRTKTKVKGAVRELAMDLVKLYAARQESEGYVCGPDTVWQREFEEMFPYEETQDQLDAIEATKRDMESTKIMDRLVCGDVGFGKTEVAIRAAFKMVQEGRQCAVLVPTTILAQQHYNTFCQRMKEYPVNIGLLSRFRTKAEQKKTLEDLKAGRVDIVIGTHRLLSKDVEFKNLGLLVVDEEQRFGVTHKEKIKKIKENVDVFQSILVVDAMRGQDAVNVAKEFNEKVGVDGIIITKMDGDTRGGAALSIRSVTGKPILYVGMGEKLEDLQQFYPDRMTSRILGMGDVLSLIEKAEQTINEEDALRMTEKMKKAEFDFNDFLDQMDQMKKMGGLSNLLSMIPGVGNKMQGLDIDDGMMDKTAAIIYSMTKEERANPKIINASRKRRIAAGAGVPIAEVNRLCKQVQNQKQMMKQMSGMFGGKGGKRGGFKLPF